MVCAKFHIAVSAIFAFSLLGCAQATKIYGSDGLPAQLIECSGTAVPMSACFSKANEVCPTGYVLISQSQSGAAISSTVYGTFGATGINKSIVVRCK